MGFWNVQEPYYADKAILRSVNNIEAVTSVSIDAAVLGLNKKGKKTVPAGMWLASVSGVDRFLPRTRLTADAATGDTTFTTKMAEVLAIGDTLQAQEQKGSIAVGGTYAIGDTIYVSYDKGSIAYKVTDPAAVAEGLAAYINASSYEVRAVQNGTSVDLYSPDGGTLTASTSGAGTVTVTDYAPLGFIGGITGINYETGEVTVDTALTFDMKEGAGVGVAVDKIYGFHKESIDFTNRPTCILSAISGSDGVYSQSFPYLDSDIVARFPRINFT